MVAQRISNLLDEEWVESTYRPFSDVPLNESVESYYRILQSAEPLLIEPANVEAITGQIWSYTYDGNTGAIASSLLMEVNISRKE